MTAVPASDITVFTSAKSTLIRPGVVMRSVMPRTPLVRTSSAIRKASVTIGVVVGDLEEPLVRNDDQRVDRLLEGLDALLGLHGAASALETERPGDDTDGQRAEGTGDLGDDRGTAGAGATAFAGGDEDHVGALEGVLDLVAMLVGGLTPDLGVGAGAESAGRITPDVELDVGIGHQQGLGVGVDRDELDAADAGVDHPVDGVDAAAADADDLDHGEVAVRNVVVDRHDPPGEFPRG